MKKRHYRYFFEENKHHAELSINIDALGTLHYKTIEVDQLDVFEGDMEFFAFPIKYIHHVDKLFELFDLETDMEQFYKQCRDVISVPEKHQNEKGKDGKLNFQVYFHDVPASLEAINDKATVVIALDTSMNEANKQGKKKYKLIGYIHANNFQFAPKAGSEERHDAYYYNVLRVSEEVQNGKKVYRRSGIFSTIFAVLLDIGDRNDTHFAYCAMGKENEKINTALIKLAKHFDKDWEIHSTSSNAKITRLFGSKRCSKKLVDITNDDKRLRELYEKMILMQGNHLFNQYPTFDDFHYYYKRVMAYAKTSGSYMIADKDGKMLAASVTLNLGDFFDFVLDNPKGALLKFIASLELTNRMLYSWLIVGEPSAVKTLYKGIAYKYRKEHGTKMALYNSYPGDPYSKIKSGLISDPYNYFAIYDRPELYQQFRENSKDENGNVRIFIDVPLI